MKQNYDFKLDKIKDLSSEEINLRKKNLDLFYQTGFPNKKEEDWKFSDLNSILRNNFNKIANNDFSLWSEFIIFTHKYSLANFFNQWIWLIFTSPIIYLKTRVYKK